MPENIPGEYVNRSGLARLHGVSLPTVDDWVRKGMPVVKRGSKGVEWQFDPAACYAWRMQRELDKREDDDKPQDIDALERRKLIAVTTQEEVKAARALQEVADIATMERNLARAFATVRANLRNVPARSFPLLVGITDEREFKRVLGLEIDTALEALAAADLTADDEEDEADE